VAEAKKTRSVEQLEQLAAALSSSARQDFRGRLKAAGKMAVIAEFKRASPSKGDIVPDLDPASQCLKYAHAGAAAVSVLTEPTWFKGSLDDMLAVRHALEESFGSLRPAILRKDFIVDEYQLLEAKAFGADAVLLIVAILTDSELVALLAAADRVGLGALVEVANEVEMQRAVRARATVIGINNRNLHTFEVSMETSSRVMSTAGIPPETLVAALSGITGAADVQRYSSVGIGAVLVGESLMRATNPLDAVRKLTGTPRVPLIKMCGITQPAAALQARHAGANLVGLVFAPASPRRVDLAAAKAVVAAVRKARGVDAIDWQDAHCVRLRKECGDTTPHGWLEGWSRAIAYQARRAGPLVVGVFADQPVEEVRRISAEAGLDIVQLSGDEGFDICGEFSLPVVKAVHVATEDTAESVLSKIPTGKAAAVLLDTRHPNMKGGSGHTFDWSVAAGLSDIPFFLAGGLSPDNVQSAVLSVSPWALDVSSGIEFAPGQKDDRKMIGFVTLARNPSGSSLALPPVVPDYADEERSTLLKTMYGSFGGRFVPETLVEALDELERGYIQCSNDPVFQAELREKLEYYVGRETPLYLAKRLTERGNGARIWLKREDLAHTGAHKINNCIGQALLAKRLGKKRIIAETGAGQHGVATATACALLGMECIVYMGGDDTRRQSLNVFRMKTLGAKVVAVESGSRTLKDAINEAMRDWVTNVRTTHYIVGSAIGPHPFPRIVRDFQCIIGRETRRQILEQLGKLPDAIVACVGGGSNAIGFFYPFVDDAVQILGAEAAGEGLTGHRHSATLATGVPGVLHGTRTFLIQDVNGQIGETHSISAGLDYPGVGPEHSFFHASGRVLYTGVTDDECMAAFSTLTTAEGIIPALESSHAVAKALEIASSFPPGSDIVVCLSGRGDKDMGIVASTLGVTL